MGKFAHLYIANTMINRFLLITTTMVVLSCGQAVPTGDFTEAEKALIHEADSIMRVLTINNDED